MNEITHMEISPGTIRFQECSNCFGDMFTFDTVALNNEGVEYVGTIRRCPGCEEGDGNG